MLKADKERVIAELVERLRTSDTLILADYRGLSMKEIDGLRTELLKLGARVSVVKNTLTRRAAETAGVEELKEFLEGPTAIAFVAEGDMIAVAKALSDTARRTRILNLKGGILQGRPVTADQVRELAACLRQTSCEVRSSALSSAPSTPSSDSSQRRSATSWVSSTHGSGNSGRPKGRPLRRPKSQRPPPTRQRRRMRRPTRQRRRPKRQRHPAERGIAAGGCVGRRGRGVARRARGLRRRGSERRMRRPTEAEASPEEPEASAEEAGAGDASPEEDNQTEEQEE